MKKQNTTIQKSLPLIGSAALLSFALSDTVSAANILLNSGFENGTAADADDWLELGTGTARSDISPRTGGFHAYMSVSNPSTNPPGTANFIEQAGPANIIDNALNYDLSFYAKVDSTDFTGQDIFFQILWLDADGSDGGGVKGETLTQLIPAGISTTYQEFGIPNMDAPDGSDSFLLRFQLSAGAVPDITQGFSVDDASLGAVVPEPASLGLFSLAGLLTLARRKRA
ncbi:PEP-CTERM sorting domain-containing protein [Akkermansiaceae bacterium]|nr:PEP-CTERM sorting domain-containing protein [Akkermansiaceae bacterium]MDB4332080.1 PEP-CTERM sorting domain-containing protein [Akkermansiaceae bacterium]MDB4614880.1 PEP-CTERM sorting domain-containing protein [Akkermansiaceae bacterium]MDB4667759.1 PEP-CTERM sorting domain-containing protein [Akkermansiaceae bacterium]